MGIIFNIEESVRNSGFNVLQEPIKMILDKQVEAYEKESIIDKFFVKKTTDRYMEEYRSLTAMDGFKPTEDMEVAPISDFEESYFQQFTFQTWTNSFVISKQTMEDGNMNNINGGALNFIKSHGRTRELYAVRVIGAALGNEYPEYKILAKTGKGMDTTTGEIEGEKQVYFHKAHKTVKLRDGRVFDKDGNVVAKGTPDAKPYIEQSNKFSIADLDMTSGKVADLEEKVLDVLGQVEAKMAVYKDDKGNIIPVEVDTIFVGKNYRLVDVLKRGLQSRYGAAMGGNGVNTQYGKYTIVECPYLSGIDGFKDADNGLILASSSRNQEGLGAAWFDRKPLEVRSYKDDKNEANVWAGRARWGAGFGDFRAMSYVSFPAAGATAAATRDADTTIVPTSTGVRAVKVVE